MAFTIIPVPMFADNYGWIAHDAAARVTVLVDPGEPEPILQALKTRGWHANAILNTHHHPDHVGGNRAIKAATGCTIIGPQAEADKIPALDTAVQGGARFLLGEEPIVVFALPGHTRGHVGFHFTRTGAFFCGDTLFSLGCGRLFEGTAQDMWQSLLTLRALPPATKLYPAHEYSQSNARFALSVDPDNAALKARARAIDDLRARGLPTLPVTVQDERAANPFLRADDAALAASLDLAGAEPAQVFGALRARKDHFV